MSAFGVPCQCTSTWCSCGYASITNTTSSTIWGNSPTWTTWTVAIPTKPNKAQRWFDCFRGAPPLLIPALLVAIEAVRRCFQPVNAAERRRQKRKQFIQRLTRATS